MVKRSVIVGRKRKKGRLQYAVIGNYWYGKLDGLTRSGAYCVIVWGAYLTFCCCSWVGSWVIDEILILLDQWLQNLRVRVLLKYTVWPCLLYIQCLNMHQTDNSGYHWQVGTGYGHQKLILSSVIFHYFIRRLPLLIFHLYIYFLNSEAKWQDGNCHSSSLRHYKMAPIHILQSRKMRH